LVPVLGQKDKPAFASGLCAGLGLIDPESLGGDEHTDLGKTLAELYQHSPDPGTHSAAGWALRRWQILLPALPFAPYEDGERHWFINRLGMTMLEIDSGTFIMGDLAATAFPRAQASLAGLGSSPQALGPLLVASGFQPIFLLYQADDPPHRVHLSRPTFIGDCEVAVRDFQKFMGDARAERPAGWSGARMDVSPTPDCPVQNVSWFDALLFCNWLSDQEGLTRCYEPTGEKQWIQEFTATGPRRVQCDIWRWRPEANGYRLATEAEWEYACRAGTRTRYAFGDNPTLLHHYAVYRSLRTEPCASRLPNAWGLFDMHGNVLEWCWDRNGRYTSADVLDPKGPTNGMLWLCRGGSYNAPEEHCASAARAGAAPTQRSPGRGFRVVCAKRSRPLPH
jgi:formylglycine-generating enzyme required for sulfatase activity